MENSQLWHYSLGILLAHPVSFRIVNLEDKAKHPFLESGKPWGSLCSGNGLGVVRCPPREVIKKQALEYWFHELGWR